MPQTDGDSSKGKKKEVKNERMRRGGGRKWRGAFSKTHSA